MTVRITPLGIRRVAWHLGVILSAVMLATAFLNRNLLLTVGVVPLIWVLKRNAAVAGVPRVYRERGITQEMFTGDAGTTPRARDSHTV